MNSLLQKNYFKPVSRSTCLTGRHGNVLLAAGIKVALKLKNMWRAKLGTNDETLFSSLNYAAKSRMDSGISWRLSRESDWIVGEQCKRHVLRTFAVWIANTCDEQIISDQFLYGQLISPQTFFHAKKKNFRIRKITNDKRGWKNFFIGISCFFRFSEFCGIIVYTDIVQEFTLMEV